MMIRFQRAHSSANHFGLPVFILPLTIGYWLIALSKQKNSLASICCCCIDKETARHPAFKVADVWDNNIINQPFRRCQRECHRRATATLRTSYYFSLFFCAWALRCFVFATGRASPNRKIHYSFNVRGIKKRLGDASTCIRNVYFICYFASSIAGCIRARSCFIPHHFPIYLMSSFSAPKKKT
jgi:hypothetical protein